MDTGDVSDEGISNNKDHYKVFHTVLNTVPMLFHAYGDIILMVQGSDSKKEYIDRCLTTCSKKCQDGICKNAHRRIGIYRSFIDKHFEELTQNYDFSGGEGIDNQTIIEPYERGKKYDAVFVMGKKS